MPLNIDESREMDPASRRTFGKLKRYLPQSGTDAQRLALNTSALPVPTRFFDSTNKVDWLWDGVGWIIMAEGFTTTFVPTLSASVGIITTPGTRSFSYSRSNGVCTWSASLSVTTAGTAAGAYLFFSLPVVPAPPYIGTGREGLTTGKQFSVLSSGAVGQILYYDNTGVVQNGTQFVCSGVFQMSSRYS